MVRTVFLVALAMLAFQSLRGATVTFNGGVEYQVIDGFGVNANHRSWNNDELKPVLDALIDQAGMTLFRVVCDNTDWESSNDDADPNVMNWVYYNTVYSANEFTKMWEMVAYLNRRGITNGACFNFMGPGPAWMGGGTLTPGMEGEWAEMVASLLVYARNVQGLQFQLVAPDNEPDISNEGIHIGDATQYATALRKLAENLDADGLGDVRLVAPDLAGGGTTYMPQMMADPVVMAKVAHFGVHSYSDTGGGSSGVYDLIRGSAYPDRTFWVTEFNVWCSTCDSGTRGTYDWAYCKGTADYLLNHLANNASGGIVWEGYDSYYLHPPTAWSFWGLFSVDNENAAVKTYTPRKNFYTLAQISKFVRPGAQRIGVSGSSSPFSPLLAFQHTGLGQITIVGINTSGSAATLTGALAALPTIPQLDLCYTSATTNLANGGSAALNNGTFSATIPGDCVFTLTGFTGVNVALTNPASGAQFTAPASIPLAASATTTAGGIALVGFYNGLTQLGEATIAPFEITWNNVPMGDYALTAVAGDTLGNVGTSAVVNVTVVGPLAQIVVTPTNATVPPGGTQQFSATGADPLGHIFDSQPAFSWSVSGGGTISGSGLFTAGGLAGGPFNVLAGNGDLMGTATVSVSVISGGGTIGNTNEGTLTDTMWDGGAWINACRFQAASNMTVTTMFSKVGSISGKYQCAIYADSSNQPSQLLGTTAEVINPASGWQSFLLTSSVAMTKSSYYWLAIWSDNSSGRVYYSNTAGTLRWGKYSYGVWPNPISTTGGGTLGYCIYGTGTGAALTNITVTPVNPSIPSGGTQSFTATGSYSDGSTQNLTSQTMWNSSNPTVATISTNGLATAMSVGDTTISAALAGVSGSSSLTVQATPVTITTPTLPGGTMGIAYMATLAASGGTTPFIWSILNGLLPPGVAIDSASGALSGTPTAAGTFSFSVQVADTGTPMQTASKSFSVSIAPTLTSISVTPVSPAFVAGATQQFKATGNYSDGSAQDVTSQAAWVASNTAIASITAGGLATGVSPGSTTITTALGGLTGSTSVTILAPPAGLGDYRSVNTGIWTDATIWQTNSGTAWLAASRPPTNSSSAGIINIRSGHTVSVASPLTIDQVLVEAGGQLTVNNVALTIANGTGTDLDVSGTVILSGTAGVLSASSGATIVFRSGATYQQARSAGTIPTATWDTNSTCLVSGATSALPGGLDQGFGHFTWNCAAQSAALNLELSMSIAGNFTVSATGSGSLRLLNSSTARTMNVGGDFIQSGGTFNLKNSSGTAILNVTRDFSQTGGTFTLRSGSASGSGTVNVARNFSLSAGTLNLSSAGAVGTLNVGGNYSHTGGTITETSSGSGAIIFTAGVHTNASGGTVANAINFTVNSGATLMLGTSLLGNGSSGTFTLVSGGALGIGDPAGISTSGTTGNIRVTGTRSFNTGADYVFNGTTAQVPGNGLPATVNNLTIARTGGFTLNTTNTVNGTCLVSPGARLLGTGRINNGLLVLSGTLGPGISVGRLTTARETWNGGGSYYWEVNNASGAPGSGWDLLSLTTGQGIDLQAADETPFILKLITLNGTNRGLATNFSKNQSYTWPIAIATNATVTNFAADKFVLDTTQFSNDFGGGTFSVELSGSELRLKFAAAPSQLTVNTASLPNGVVGAAYAATLTAAGGITPYTWSIVNGSLPAGLTLSQDSGAITGAPGAAGTFNLTAQVKDANNPAQSASRTLTLVVDPALASISVTPSNPSILVGGSQQFTATGTYSDGSAQNLTGVATWTSSNPAVATINSTGLASGLTAGMTTISATLGSVRGSTTLTIQPLTLAIMGNTTEGTLTDSMWSSGAWINACRFQAASNMTVATMRAKVGAIPGKYKCSIYTDTSSQPNRLLGATAEVSNPAGGWLSLPLTSSVMLTNRGYYWLAIWSDDASARVYYSGNTGTLRWGRYNYGTWPDPIATSGGNSLNYCIYATQ